MIKETFTDVEMVVEMKLPRGACELSDVQKMRDMMNLANVLIYAGYTIDGDHILNNYADEINDGVDAFGTFYARALEGRFTCTGDEMNALRNAFQIWGLIVRSALEGEPAWVFDCFNWVKAQSESAAREGKRTRVDMTNIEKQIRLFSHVRPVRRFDKLRELAA